MVWNERNDGVGQDRIDRYSCCLNPETGPGVDRWQIMERSCDDDNLEKLVTRLELQL